MKCEQVFQADNRFVLSRGHIRPQISLIEFSILFHLCEGGFMEMECLKSIKRMCELGKLSKPSHFTNDVHSSVLVLVMSRFLRLMTKF
jgi:hypothetical protein